MKVPEQRGPRPQVRSALSRLRLGLVVAAALFGVAWLGGAFLNIGAVVHDPALDHPLLHALYEVGNAGAALVYAVMAVAVIGNPRRYAPAPRRYAVGVGVGLVFLAAAAGHIGRALLAHLGDGVAGGLPAPLQSAIDLTTFVAPACLLAMRDGLRALCGGEALMAELTDRAERQRRAAMAHSAQSRFNQAVLDALRAEIAVLDDHGVIVAVNAAWQALGQQNGEGSAGVGVGATYRDVCHAVLAEDQAGAALAGVRAVLRREQPEFSIEYESRTAAGVRWWVMLVTPLGPGMPGAVVAHHDVTEARSAVDALRRREAQFRALVQNASDVIIVLDPAARVQYGEDPR
ncbi:MAG: PAS domain-containing protein [Dehalococcoidia bacterium]